MILLLIFCCIAIGPLECSFTKTSLAVKKTSRSRLERQNGPSLNAFKKLSTALESKNYQVITNDLILEAKPMYEERFDTKKYFCSAIKDFHERLYNTIFDPALIANKDIYPLIQKALSTISENFNIQERLSEENVSLISMMRNTYYRLYTKKENEPYRNNHALSQAVAERILEHTMILLKQNSYFSKEQRSEAFEYALGNIKNGGTCIPIQVGFPPNPYLAIALIKQNSPTKAFLCHIKNNVGHYFYWLPKFATKIIEKHSNYPALSTLSQLSYTAPLNDFIHTSKDALNEIITNPKLIASFLDFSRNLEMAPEYYKEEYLKNVLKQTHSAYEQIIKALIEHTPTLFNKNIFTSITGAPSLYADVTISF